ncbi:hypothetical protein D3C72_2347240 [compost metagenome]
MMPYAKGVSAKSMNFAPNGDESDIDYYRMFEIIKAAKWSGLVGIEYSGKGPEDEGILKTKALLEKILQRYK